MPPPRVFVSSTWYDLRHVRDDLTRFISSLGYEPVLAEHGDIYYDPKTHVQDACLAEVAGCQLSVLLIGGRHGSSFKGTEKSITNREYEEAVKQGVPVFALVQKEVYHDYGVYTKNKENKDVDAAKIQYSAVDNVRVFDFIDEVQSQAVNNAIVPFENSEDISEYLRRQWAAMMYSFLQAKNESREVANTMRELRLMNEKIEMLARTVLDRVGTSGDVIEAELRALVLSSELNRELSFLAKGHVVSLEAVLQSKSYSDCFELSDLVILPPDEAREEYKGCFLIRRKSDGKNLVQSSALGLQSYSRNYKALRQTLLKTLGRYGMDTDTFLSTKAVQKEQAFAEEEELDFGKIQTELIGRLRKILRKGPRSFEWLRNETGIQLLDGEFDKVINENADVFARTRIIARDKHGRRIIPGRPGMKLLERTRDAG
jgi:hypothetical protein